MTGMPRDERDHRQEAFNDAVDEITDRLDDAAGSQPPHDTEFLDGMVYARNLVRAVQLAEWRNACECADGPAPAPAGAASADMPDRVREDAWVCHECNTRLMRRPPATANGEDTA